MKRDKISKKKSKKNIRQLIQWDDETGMLKNISELLQEIRDKKVSSLVLGYTRKDGSVRTYYYGDHKEVGELYLTYEQMKYDFLDGRFADVEKSVYLE